MGRILISTIAFGLLFMFSGPVWAGGARVQARVGSVAIGATPGSVVFRSWVYGRYPMPGQPFYHLNPYPYPYSYYYRPYYPSLIVVSPYHYSHYTAPEVVLSSPFYCYVHYMGFISRVGFIDHMSGAHKISLETAASVCPDGRESCVIEGY